MHKFPANNGQGQQMGSAQGLLQGNGSRKSSLTRNVFNNRQVSQKVGSATHGQFATQLSLQYQQLQRQPSGGGQPWVKQAPIHQVPQQVQTLPARAPVHFGSEGRREPSQQSRGPPTQGLPMTAQAMPYHLHSHGLPAKTAMTQPALASAPSGAFRGADPGSKPMNKQILNSQAPLNASVVQNGEAHRRVQQRRGAGGAQTAPQRRGGARGKAAHANLHAHLYHEYLVQCTIREAKLSKDLSSFFGQMSVYCEVKFQSTSLKVKGVRKNQSLTTAQELAHSSKDEFRVERSEQQTSKLTQVQTGQMPKWEETFTFNYQKLSKACLRLLNRPPNPQNVGQAAGAGQQPRHQQNNHQEGDQAGAPELNAHKSQSTSVDRSRSNSRIGGPIGGAAGASGIPRPALGGKPAASSSSVFNRERSQGPPQQTVHQNSQRLDFALFKRTMLFTKEKIGAVTLHIHNCDPGGRANWLVLTNDNDDEVGKLLVYVEIKRDTTQRQLRLIQKDLNMQDQVPKMDDGNPDAQKPGMNIDMTEDKGMPLRNHEQVLLLNERQEPQSNQQSSNPQQPTSTQVVHLTSNTSPQTQQTQVTQITHVTHQTQNSALLIGGLGGVLQAQPAPSNQRSFGGLNGTQQNLGRGDAAGQTTSTTPNGPATSGQQNRLTSSSLIMGATNVTNVTNPAANCNGGGSSHLGGGLALGPLYLETTNIIPNNKLSKKSNQMMMMHGSMISVMHKEDESEDEDDEDDEYADEDDEYGEEGEYGEEYAEDGALVEAAAGHQDHRGGREQMAGVDPRVHNRSAADNRYENANDNEVAQIIGTGGNLQTHCREEDEDDEIDSGEEGNDAAPAVREDKKMEAQRQKAQTANNQVMQGGGTQLRSSQLAGRPPRDAFGGGNATEDSDSSQLLMGGAGLLGIGMGVVETQQIREDDEEDDDEVHGNEPQDHYQEYAGEFELGMTKDTPQAVEGGGPSQSTGGQNTHGNSGAPNSSHNTLRDHSQQSEATAGTRGAGPGSRSQGPGQGFQLKHQKPIQQPQRVDQSKGRVYQEMDSHSKSAKQPIIGGEQSAPDIEAEEDDESNINSDEQDEYLECVPGQTNYQHFASNELDVDNNLDQQHQYSKHNQKSANPGRKHSEREKHGGMLQYQGYVQRPQTAQTAGGQQRLIQQQHPAGSLQPPFTSSNSLQISQNYHSQLATQPHDPNKLLFGRPHQQMAPHAQQAARSQTFQQDEPSYDHMQQQHYQNLRPVGAPHQVVGPGRAQTSMAQRRYANQNFRTTQGSQHSGPAPLPRGPAGQMAAAGSHPAKQGHVQAQASHGRANRAGRNKYIDINTIEVEPSFRQRKSIFQQSRTGNASQKQAPQSRSKDRIVMRKKVMPISNTPGASLQNLNMMSNSISRGGQSSLIQINQEDGRLQKKNNSTQRRGLSQNKQIKSSHAVQDPSGPLAEPQLDHHSISYQAQYPSASIHRLHHQQSASHNPPPIFSQMPPNNRLQQSRNRPGVHPGGHKPVAANQKQRNPAGGHSHAHTQHTPSHHLATQTAHTQPALGGHPHGAIKSSLPTQQHTQMHTQLYTQEAQHNTHWTNHTNGEFGDFNMGEIDDEDLLQNHDDYDDEEYGAEHDDVQQPGGMRGQAAINSDDQYDQEMGVCSEGDEERYERDQQQDEHVKSPLPFKHGRQRGGEEQALQVPHHGAGGQDHQEQAKTSKSKKKRRQPSQEPDIVTNAVQLGGPQRLPGDAVHQMPHGVRASIGSRGSTSAGGALGSNPLEQETFSMQHDTFQGQADGAEQQDFGSQSHGMYPQLRQQLGLEGDHKKGYSRERTANQNFASGPSGQHLAGFGSNGLQAQQYHGSASSMGTAGAVSHGNSNNQVNLYQNNAKQAKMMNRRKKIEETSGQYQGQYLVGQGIGLVAPTGYATNHQHGYQGGVRSSQLQNNQFAHQMLDHSLNNAGNGPAGAEAQMDHSVIQHITSQSQSDSDDLNAAGQLPNDGSQLYQQQQRFVKSKSKRTQQHHKQRELMHEQPDGVAGLGAHLLMPAMHGNAHHQSTGIQIGGATLQQHHQGSGSGAVMGTHGKKSRNGPDGHQTLMQQYNTYQECRDGLGVGVGGFEDESREDDWMATSGAGGHLDSSDNPHQGMAPQSLAAHMKRPKGSTQHNPKSILNTINSQNSRAMSHEFQLNQMHKSISEQWDKIKRQKAELKRERVGVAAEAKALKEQQEASEAKAKQLKAKQHQVKRDRLMVSNEAQKIKVLHQQFTDLLQTQQARGGNANCATVEVSEKLGSIKMMLELLLNDRDAMKGGNNSLDSSSSAESKRDESKGKEGNAAEETDTQQSSLMPTKKSKDKRAGEAEPSTASKDRPEHNQLEQIVQVQARLEEMNQVMLMQNMQMQKMMMNNQMNQNINHFHRMHSQMASITTASHLQNQGLITPTGPPEFADLGTLAASASAQKEPTGQQQQQVVNFLPPQQYHAPASNMFAANSSLSQNLPPQNHALPNASTSPLSSTHAFLQNMHGEQASHPITAPSHGPHHFAMYPEQNAVPHVQEEGLDNLREYGANLDKNQQLENQMMQQMPPQMVPTHALQSMPQVTGQAEQQPAELGAFPQRDEADGAGAQAYDGQQQIDHDHQALVQQQNPEGAQSQDAAAADNHARSSSSQSEFVYDPDPDFLNKINHNIRVNNGNVGSEPPPPNSEMACFGMRNLGAQLVQQQEMRTAQEGHQRLTALNSQGSDEQRDDEGRDAQQPILSGAMRPSEPNERLDLISRGSDVQIEEADVEDIMPAPGQGLREAAARNQQSVIDQSGPTQSLAINEDDALQLDGQRAKLQLDGLQQHANTDRNSMPTQFKENLVQGTQGDFIAQHCHQQAISAESSNSQIPSSQMSAFQSIQQRLKLGMNQNANVPVTSQDMHGSQQLQNLLQTHNDQNMLEGSNMLNLHAFEPMTAGGSSLTPSPSPGPSRATASGKGAANRQVGLVPDPKSEAQRHEEIAKTPEAAGKSNQQQVSREEQRQPKKIEEDEILRLIHESQEAQEWSESQSMYDSSQTDTFHGRPRGITAGIGQGNKRGATDAPTHGNAQSSGLQAADGENSELQTTRPHGRHQPTPSIVFGAAGEIYDEPKKAVYGIKKAKNAF